MQRGIRQRHSHALARGEFSLFCSILTVFFFSWEFKITLAVVPQVHYWPGEVILVGGDLPRETIFLSSGTLELISEDGNIIREIFADGDPYPRAAATEFFIGLRLQFTTRVSASSDAKVFSLRKTDYDDVKAEFPNMHEQVRKNLLTSFGLTTEGVDMTEDSQKEEDDAWHRMLRGPVQEALKKRHGERLAKAMNSARSADWRSLMTYIDAGLQGRECDYDSISLVHATASSGSGYGCELLSYRGADVTAHDRWGHTPLDYALLGGWIGTGGQLHNMGSNLSSIGLGDRLVKHARSDETESLKVLLKNGADPNIGDVDQRSPLHAASRTGAIGCVHELLRAGADVSLPDPAGLRPLDDVRFLSAFWRCLFLWCFMCFELFARFVSLAGMLQEEQCCCIYTCVQRRDHCQTICSKAHFGVGDAWRW